MSADDGFEIVASVLVAETPFLRLEEVSLRSPDGDIAARTVVRVGGAVAMLVVDDDEVVLIRQYRTPLDHALLEIPAGKLDVPGEDPKECARREDMDRAFGRWMISLQSCIREHFGSYGTCFAFGASDVCHGARYAACQIVCFRNR